MDKKIWLERIKNNEVVKVLFVTACSCLFLMLILAGCSKVTVSEEKIKDMEYTVVSADELPEELLKVIESKKEMPFKLTFQDKDCLYICKGYGAQKGCGYSIQMEEFYETVNALYFKAGLIGPGEEEVNTENISYPYIVIKCEYTDKTVVFD